jgi:flagellar hook protein FlgE
MSINSAMRAGVSGLIANSAALAAISDNIANVNTVGYKRNQTDFTTIVTASSSTGTYSAGGVLSANHREVARQGLLQQTQSATDLGISGSGFFVVTDKSTDLTADDARLFTRAGSFQVDKQGYLRNSAGFYLQGWVADSDGDITNTSNINALGSINVSAIGGVATPTTLASISGNLKADQPFSAAALAAVSGGAGAYDAATVNNMSNYDPEAGTGVKPDYSIQFSVGDSKGVKHTMQLDFLRNADPTNPNTWYAEIHAIPETDIDGATNGHLVSGMVAFTSDGIFDPDPARSTLFADWTNPVINIGASDDPAAPIKWAEALGSSAQDLRIELGVDPGYMTQLATASTQSVTTNGTAFGGLSNIEVSEDGTVTANFDNGLSRRIAKVAVATFANPDGLTPASGNAFRASLNSGPYSLKSPGEAGAGSISPSMLEASTVDLSSEFTGLITTQRAYSASSKIITTADQMLEELLSIKR